jgi:osmotically-inducible protein OsmY
MSRKKGGIGMVVSDPVSAMIEEALLQDSRTRDETIDVINKQGIVTLSGIVRSEKSSQAAEEIARRQPGVVKVINSLNVKS